MPNPLGQQQAITRLDAAVDKMLAATYQGIKITDPQKAWDGGTLNLSLRAGAGFLNILIVAKAVVDDKQVLIECELPSLVKQFMPEAKIHDEVEAKVKEVLAP